MPGSGQGVANASQEASGRRRVHVTIGAGCPPYEPLPVYRLSMVAVCSVSSDPRQYATLSSRKRQ